MDSYTERPPLPGLAGVVRTVWIQRTGAAAYEQRHLPTGGVEIHFPIGGRPQLVGPLTGPEIEVIPPHTTIVGVRFRPGTAPPLPAVLDDLVDQRLSLAELWGRSADRLVEAMARAETPERALTGLQAHLLQEFRGAAHMDPLVREAVQALMPWHPVNIGALATHLALSASQLRRRCLQAVEDLVAAWQAWAPDAPDELTVNLTLESEPGAPARATLFGASTLEEGPTRELLREFTDRAFELHASLPYHRLKQTFAEPDPRDLPERAVRTRSEFFSHGLSDHTLASLLSQFNAARTEGRRQLTFTAMGGAYNRVAEDATAFAHRGERFLLEHIGEPADPWVDRSWATAHADGSGRVYPNFPTPPSTTGPRRTTRATTAGWWRSRTPTTRTGSSTSPKPSEEQRRRDLSKVFSAHAVSVDELGVRLGPDEEFARSSLHRRERLPSRSRRPPPGAPDRTPRSGGEPGPAVVRPRKRRRTDGRPRVRDVVRRPAS